MTPLVVLAGFENGEVPKMEMFPFGLLHAGLIWLAVVSAMPERFSTIRWKLPNELETTVT